MQIIEAKLHDLKIDPANVRQTDKAPDEGLLASIRAKGLIVPLTVRKNGAGYFVIDGGKRLAALHILVRDGDIKKDDPVACILREGDAAAAADTSLTLNFIREGMHPVDEFEAFAKLVEGGKTPEAIAKDYGIPLKMVGRSLALGRLAPEVRAAWRAGDIDEDSAKAFTLETDLTRQATIYKKLGRHGRHSWAIRDAIIGDSRQAPGLLRLVGIEAYKAAGGATTEDLFTDAKAPELIATDFKLLKKLADEKIAATIERLKGEGWKWVSDGSDLPSGSQWWDSKPKSDIKAEGRAKYGVIVRQNHNGDFDIKYGVTKPSEKKAADKKKAVAKGEASEVSISAALCGRISASMGEAAAEVLKTDSNLALAIVAAALTSYDSPVHIGGDSGKGAKFSAQLLLMRKKSAGDLHKVLADVAALSLSIGASSQDNLPLAKNSDNDRALLEALDAKKLNAELRDSFDAADYFAGVTAQACKDAIALCDPKQPITGKEKKSELAKLAADLVKKSNASGKAGYLPPEMRTKHYDGPALKPAAKATATKKKARRAMVDKAFLEQLSRELADQGKLIEAGWVSLRLVAIPLDASKIQLDEMRNAFFAGAQHLFSSIVTILEPDAEPTDKDLERMGLIDKELRAFFADFKVRNLPTQGMA